MTNNKTIIYLLIAAFIMVTAVFGALRLAGLVSGGDVPAVAMNKADVEKIVKNYLMENPEVIIEAVNGLRDKDDKRRAAEEKEQVAKMKEKAKVHAAALYAEPEPLVAGNPKGDLTVVEFFDYRCPYCRKVKKTVSDLLAQDGNIRLVLKEFPILSPESEFAAQAAIASVEQGKYWDFHLAMMGEEDLSPERIFELAKGVGIDVARLKADMKKPKVAKRLGETDNLARALGVNATPTFFIGGEPLTGNQSLEELKAAVAAARKAKAS